MSENARESQKSGKMASGCGGIKGITGGKFDQIYLVFGRETIIYNKFSKPKIKFDSLINMKLIFFILSNLKNTIIKTIM